MPFLDVNKKKLHCKIIAAIVIVKTMCPFWGSSVVHI